MNVSMIQTLGFNTPSRMVGAQKAKAPVTSPISTPSFSGVSNAQLSQALRALNGIQLAATVPFKGLGEDITALRAEMKSCPEKGGGESAGDRIEVGKLIRQYNDKFKPRDKEEATIEIAKQQDKKTKEVTGYTDGFVNVSKDDANQMWFTLETQNRPAAITTPDKRIDLINARYNFAIEKPELNNDVESYMLITKGNPTAVVEDKELNAVLLTPNGSIEKANSKDGRYSVSGGAFKDSYVPFEVENVPDVSLDPKFAPSQGKGGELVVAMEDGRYVPETVAALKQFVEKVQSGEIDFGPFVERKGADKFQVVMLAGGYGSRAEHANASSNKILHYGQEDGADGNKAQTNKGIMQLPTGLNAMETTFRTLHEAGVFNCSKDTLKLGDNLKLYINKTNKNRGNGGFTLDVYNTMKGANTENVLIVPNDAISRMTKATKKLADIAERGDAAMIMIAKKVPMEDARGKLGIMALDPETNEIIGFDEKPPVVQPEYIDKDGNCVSNTFQFTVSNEAFEALNILEPYFPGKDMKGGESRDWSGCLTPIIKSIVDNEEIADIQGAIANAMEAAIPEAKREGLKQAGELPVEIPEDVAKEVKELLKGQKIYAVPTDESWVDAGNMKDMYDTTMGIAKDEFKVSNTERANVLKCINTQTGLVTNSPELKDKVEAKYETQGRVVAVEKAAYVDPAILDECADAITYNYGTVA